MSQTLLRTRIEEAFEFGEGGQVLVSTRSPLRLNESGKIERRDSATKCYHRYRVSLHIVKSAQAGHLRQQVDFTYVGLKGEDRSVAQGPVVPNERKACWETSRPRVEGSQRVSEPAEVGWGPGVTH